MMNKKRACCKKGGMETRVWMHNLYGVTTKKTLLDRTKTKDEKNFKFQNHP